MNKRLSSPYTCSCGSIKTCGTLRNVLRFFEGGGVFRFTDWDPAEHLKQNNRICYQMKVSIQILVWEWVEKEEEKCGTWKLIWQRLATPHLILNKSPRHQSNYVTKTEWAVCMTCAAPRHVTALRVDDDRGATMSHVTTLDGPLSRGAQLCVCLLECEIVCTLGLDKPRPFYLFILIHFL